MIFVKITGIWDTVLGFHVLLAVRSFLAWTLELTIKKIKISKLMNKKKHKTRISPSSNLAIILSMFSLSVSAPFPPPGPNTLLSIVHLKKLETHQDCEIEWINGDVFTIAGFRTSGLFWQPVTELQMAGLVDAAAHRWSHL